MAKNNDPLAISRQKRRLCQSRIRFCFGFVRSRNGDCEGFRHRLMLVLVLAATPLYDIAEVNAMASQLSMMFVPTPLDITEIKDILHYVTQKGPYNITNKRICDWFQISEDRYDDLALSKRKAEDREAKKRENARRKEERNQKICDAIANGSTYSEAAQLAGCSVRTVGNVLAFCREGEKSDGDTVYTTTILTTTK